MVRVMQKDGFIGGRVPKRLQAEFDKWTNDHMKSKTDIVEHCIRKFLLDKTIQEEYLASCKNGQHC